MGDRERGERGGVGERENEREEIGRQREGGRWRGSE